MQPFNNLILLGINLSFWIYFNSIFILNSNILINDQRIKICGHTLLILTIYTYLTTHFTKFTIVISLFSLYSVILNHTVMWLTILMDSWV